jgi:hypothetical protein
MIAEQIDQLLACIETIQAARRKNWKSPDEAEDEALEAEHTACIQACRAKIETLQNQQTT